MPHAMFVRKRIHQVVHQTASWLLKWMHYFLFTKSTNFELANTCTSKKDPTSDSSHKGKGMGGWELRARDTGIYESRVRRTASSSTWKQRGQKKGEWKWLGEGRCAIYFLDISWATCQYSLFVWIQCPLAYDELQTTTLDCGLTEVDTKYNT